MSKERLEALASLERELIELEAEEEATELQSIDDRLKSLEESLGGDEDLDGEIKVSISSDRTMANLTFTRHKVGGNPVAYEEIIKALMDEDIKGIDEEVIKKALGEEKFDQRILVAKGIAPDKGKDGYFTYLFKITSEEMSEEREEPKVIDEKVFAGQILAVRVAATQGKEGGVSVTGEDLPGQMGDEIKPEASDGVELVNDGLVVRAAANGSVSWLKNLVSIKEEEAPAGTTPSVIIAGKREAAGEEGARILGLTTEEIEAVEVRPDEFRIFPEEAAYRPWEKMPSKEEMEDFEKDLFGEEEAEEEVDETDEEEGSENLEELILAFKEDESLDVEDIERSLEGIKRGEGLDGEIDISISSDRALAYLTFTQHKIGGNPVTYEKIIKALKDEEIKDVDEEVIRNALNERKFNEKILVAKGIAPQKGEDGYWTYLFGTTFEEMLKEEEEVKEEAKEEVKVKVKVKEKAEKKIEEKEGEKVFAGQILAVRVAATQGREGGVSVTGEELPPQRGSEIETKAGDGIKLSRDGLTAYSTANGSVCWLKNSVSVKGKDASGKFTPSVVIAAELYQAKEEGAEILGLSLEEVAAAEEKTGRFRIFPKEATRCPWRKKKLSAEEKLEAELFGDLDLDELDEEEGEEAGEGKAEEAARTSETPSEEGEEEIANGTALVEITPDGKKANITLIPPQGGGLPLAFEDCLNALEENGVRAGIKEGAIKEAIKENTFHLPLLVAEEIPAELGVDAKIEYKFDIEEKIRFKENEEGRIDLRQLNLIQNVRADDLLAVKIPAKRGEKPGVHLNGEQIPPSLGKDVELPVGANTKISEDGFELRAAISGRVLFRGGKVEVEPVYEVKGDVGFTTGNIEFVGSVIIGGTVKEGFRVEAGGDIEVSGLVAKKAYLNSEKNVMVSGGVSGGYIEAKGDVTVKFCDNSTILAGGDINIIEESLHSFLNADKNILVSGGKKSVIIGGMIRAGNEVAADEIGNRLYTQTIVEVGAEPWVREQLEEIEDKIAEDTKRIKEGKLNLKTLESKGLKIKNGYERLIKVLKGEKILDLKLKSAYERQEILEGEITRLKTGKVKANIIYPGVLLKIRGAAKEIEKPLEEASLWFEGGEIKVESK